MEYKKISKIELKNHPEINEKIVQDIIAEDPEILGLGDLILKDIERKQPRAGRLDLLLQDMESKTRYEVELQLGKTDESHIIRVLEYWDIERKRYPQYDHVAVIIAEDITSRFLNIISLFNGHIPIIGIQMSALKVDAQFTLSFTTVLGLNQLGLVDEDEETKEITDRQYWETKGKVDTVKLADTLLSYIIEFDDSYELKYNKFYIGLSKNGAANNFASFKPRKNAIVVHLKLEKDSEIDSLLDENGFDILDYDSKWKQYRLRLSKSEVIDKKEVLSSLLKKSYEYFTG